MSLKESFVGKITVTIRPEQEFITLQAVLQVADIISTGGMAKMYLSENIVLVNDIEENRRGRKLYPGDIVKVEDKTILVKKP